MAKIDDGINCYTCKYFNWIHYTSKFIDFCNFFEESLPTTKTDDEMIHSGEKLLICKNFELHEKFQNENYADLIAQYGSFQTFRQNLQEKILYFYFVGSFNLKEIYEFEKDL